MDGLVVVENCFVIILLGKINISAIVIGMGKFWLETDDLVVVLKGVVDIAFQPVGVSAVVIGVGERVAIEISLMNEKGAGQDRSVRVGGVLVAILDVESGLRRSGAPEQRGQEHSGANERRFQHTGIRSLPDKCCCTAAAAMRCGTEESYACGKCWVKTGWHKKCNTIGD
jgi:hypothetical protein